MSSFEEMFLKFYFLSVIGMLSNEIKIKEARFYLSHSFYSLVLAIGFEPISCSHLEPMPGYKAGVLPLNDTSIFIHNCSFLFWSVANLR